MGSFELIGLLWCAAELLRLDLEEEFRNLLITANELTTMW